ncbi:MAG: DUF1926 domain-containing protein [Dehalococcoidales bacterium]|nr:DUF1926 domain-containing protein [Dehalococcoidales bacterium]
MKQIYFGLALHNHQPVGNFPWVFQQAYSRAYLPMLEALERHPGVRVSLHYSGPLIDWLEIKHPDFLSRIAVLVQRGQVEVMTGGYYEPILPIIPDKDKLGQIDKMTRACHHLFGSTPAGLWLAERVWEPGLPKILAEAGVEWTVVDDTHFKLVGLDDKDLFGYYLTEEQGYPSKVFATSKYLRYSIPWHDVSEVIEYLRWQAGSAPNSQSPVRIAVMGDDGEKFGVWPGTYQHCWENGWVEQFLTSLEENQEWLISIPLGEYARLFPPLGRVYLPCAAYDEMMEWALPPAKSVQLVNIKRGLEKERADVVQFLHGGYWRHFLVKYPEINQMHKKMLLVHKKVYQSKDKGKTDCGLTDLWQGQCNCAYWHGIFGGLYLADIRAATYHHLIQAESTADDILHPQQPWLECDEIDFDMDGKKETIVSANNFSLYFSPHRGGSLVEWDLRHPGFNLLSTISRRFEAYHQVLTGSSKKTADTDDKVRSIHDGVHVKDDEAQGRLSYDRYPRYSLIDHFLSPDITLEQFVSGSYEETGSFADQPYQVELDKQYPFLKISLSRGDRIRCGKRWVPFEVKKEIFVESGKDELRINYQLTNRGDTVASGIFGSEWNINLLGGGHNEQAYYEVPGTVLDDYHLDSTGAVKGIGELSLGNRYLGIRLDLAIEPHIALWRFPVETVSNSEAGLERLYQGSCLLLSVPFNLSPGTSQVLSLKWVSGRQK